MVEGSERSVDYVSGVTIVSEMANSFTRAAQRETLALVLSLTLTCSAHFHHVGSLLFSRAKDCQVDRGGK